MGKDVVLFRITVRGLLRFAAAGFVLAALWLVLAAPLRAQRVQEKYEERFQIAGETAGVTIATSADGRYVYVAGKNGVMISDNFGKVGSWTKTLRLK